MISFVFAQIAGFFIIYVTIVYYIYIYFLKILKKSYGLNSSIFILTPVWEKEKEVKYILNVMGTKSVSYWLGTFISDFICFTIPMLSFIGAIYAFDVPFLVPFLNKIIPVVIVKTLILIFNNNIIIYKVFGISMLVYSYAMSFLFSNSNSAFK